MKNCFIALLCVVGTYTSLAQSIFTTYTGIEGFYDYQTNYRTPQYIRVCPNTTHVHAVMMVADDSANTSASRRTAYSYSSNGGETWNTFSNLRVPARRSGFPSLEVSQGAFANAAVVCNHNAIPALQSIVFVDYPPGTGAFSELNAPPTFSGDEPIFPEVACAADGSIILIGSRAAGTTTHLTRTSDFQGWSPWSLVTPEFISDGYVAEGNATGKVGIAIGAPSSPLQSLESTNNGATWPTSPTELLPENIPTGSDTFVITPGLDFVYNPIGPLVAFGTTKQVAGSPTHRFSGIGFYSQATGFVLAVPHDSVAGVVDTLRKRQVNMYPVGYPAIGLAGSTIVIVFQAFMADTSQAGFNHADVFFTYSTNAGANWSRPRNLTNSTVLDERYASMSKWNSAGQANIVYQEDPQPGSAVFGSDASPLAKTRQRFCRVTGFPTSVGQVSETPEEFQLYQNYPNPFNPTTTISFQIPNHKPQSLITLKIFDLLGREAATLVNEEMKPGSYEQVFDASGLASGVYLYRLDAGGFVQAKKLLLLR